MPSYRSGHYKWAQPRTCRWCNTCLIAFCYLSSHTGSRPLRGSGSSCTPTTDQTNVAIFISAEGNHCKGTDPAENRALIAVPLKPNVIATDKPHPKVHRELTPLQCVCRVQQNTETHKLWTQSAVCVRLGRMYEYKYRMERYWEAGGETPFNLCGLFTSMLHESSRSHVTSCCGEKAFKTNQQMHSGSFITLFSKNFIWHKKQTLYNNNNSALLWTIQHTTIKLN